MIVLVTRARVEHGPRTRATNGLPLRNRPPALIWGTILCVMERNFLFLFYLFSPLIAEKTMDSRARKFMMKTVCENAFINISGEVPQLSGDPTWS